MRWIAATLLFLAVAALAQAPPETFLDPIAQLQKRIEKGEVTLRFSSDRGYLPSLLKELSIPVSSQSLVFSKTSLQIDHISAKTPRAVYFNDDVYVAWIPDAPMIEIASVDPQKGTAFYTLPQAQMKTPTFARLEQPCTSCHGPVQDDVPAPILLMMSVENEDLQLITDRSPFAERWGGWYVSGLPRSLKHKGTATPATVKRYLSAQSDPVALMLLAHQADVHNRINEAALAARLGKTDAFEPLVRALLFVDAAPFDASIRSSSGFAKEFSAQGPRDKRGRSLRDFDLKTRLFRYPLSYLIYSDSFREMPAAAKSFVFKRLRDVLSGKDQSEAFRHLSTADRAAIQEILTQTVPGF
jgi:hypothetical protein